MKVKNGIVGLLVACILMTSVISGALAKEGGFSGSVNINTATVEELTMLSGIGEAKATAIVAYRETTPFKTVEEISNVKGIGEKLLAKLKPQLRVSGPSIDK